MEENQFISKIKSHKEDLLKWEEELENNLKEDLIKNEDLFLISRYCFDNFKILLSNENNIENKPFNYEEIKEMNNEIFTPFEKKCRDIEKLPKLFVINKDFWKIIENENNELNVINSIGYFCNKSLILKVLEAIYCFFFLDKNNKIRQGYLKINKLDNENDLIQNFHKNGFFKFINKNQNELNDDKFEMSTDDYKIYIFEDSDKHKNISDLKNEFNNKVEILKRRANTFVSKIKKNIENPDKINYIFGSKIYDIFKTIVVNVKEKMKNIDFEEIKNDIEKHNQTAIESEEFVNPEERKVVRLRGRRKVDLQNKLLFPSPPQQKKATPGIIGLQNIGATCYMNATIQCFSNIKDLRLYLLREDKYQLLEKNKDKFKLSFALGEIFYNLWKNLDHSYYEPEYFKKMIGEMNPLFKGIAANDPKDLILFLLETIHNELNKAPKRQMDYNIFLNNQDYNIVLKDFLNNFINENQSIISDLFYGFTNSMTTCAFCRTTIHNVQSINILFFPLEEVRKFMNYTNNLVYIEDCFRYYEKQEFYPSFYCNNCRQLYPAYNQSKIISGPNNLIINLNRGRGLEFNVNIEFKEFLDLRNYIFSNKSPFYYELVGVICHLGSNDMGGHFIAFCKNSNNNNWYKYNDGMVTLALFQEVSTTRIPYVLFYSYNKK